MAHITRTRTQRRRGHCKAYQLITPCGIDEEGRGIGNVREEVRGRGGPRHGPHLTSEEVLVQQFGEVMGMQVEYSHETVEAMLQRWDDGG